MTDSGILTGSVNTKESMHAAYWDNDGQDFHDLGTLGGPLGVATWANESGVIVGVSSFSDTGPSRAWVDRGAGLEDLGTLPGDSAAAAYAINDAGIIVGVSGSHSVCWNPDGQIGILDVPSTGAPVAINDSGTVAGYSVGVNGMTAWVYQDGQTDILPDLGTGHAIVRDINGLGDVSGTVMAPDGTYHAALWHHGHIHDLNGPWVPAGWTLRDAYGVNDRGQIVGTALDAGGVTHGFLLTPVPRAVDWVFAALHRRHDGFTDPAA